MKRSIAGLFILAGAVLAACTTGADPTATSAPPTTVPTGTAIVDPTATPAPQAVLYVMSNPNKIIEIDAETNTVVGTHDIAIPGDGRWAWNDDNNYFDGTHLWLTTRNSNGDAQDLGVIALNVDTMAVDGYFRVGSGNFNPFMGKATASGILPVATRDLGTIVTIDTTRMELVDTWDAPLAVDSSGNPLYKKDLPAEDTVGGGMVVCDVDVTIGADGRELFVYPTQGNDLVMFVDALTGEFVDAVSIAPGSNGNMLSTHHLNGTVWAQENGTNSQAVFDPVTLELLGRMPTVRGPFVNSFSPDGKLSYINGGDASVTVVDTETYRVVATVEVGPNATRSAAHPNGKVVYVQVSNEQSVAVVDTSTWRVVRRIDIGAAPNAMFIREL